MEQYFETTIDTLPAITIYEDGESVKAWLIRNPSFTELDKRSWEYGHDFNVSIGSGSLEVRFEDALHTHLIFTTFALRDDLFKWMTENDVSRPAYWQKLAVPIIEQLGSNHIETVASAINAMREWVDDHNSFYVASMRNSADLSHFTYNLDDWDEEGLWPNSLFDGILDRDGKKFSDDTLFDLVHALFNSNEDYMDCKATFTCIELLWQRQGEGVEGKLIAAIKVGLGGYEPGHRAFENTLLDRLIEDVLPQFSTSSLLNLLNWAHPDLLHESSGDGMVVLARVALHKGASVPEQQRFETLLSEYGI